MLSKPNLWRLSSTCRSGPQAKHCTRVAKPGDETSELMASTHIMSHKLSRSHAQHMYNRLTGNRKHTTSKLFATRRTSRWPSQQTTHGGGSRRPGNPPPLECGRSPSGLFLEHRAHQNPSPRQVRCRISAKSCAAAQAADANRTGA